MKAPSVCLAALTALALTGGAPQAQAVTTTPLVSDYFDNTGRDDILSGGVKLIPIKTPQGNFHVWTKRIGNNPKIKVLLLHGGPGITHEIFAVFESYFPGAGIEFYYYDQLGSFYSDQPDDPALWDLARFVEEVEQVRQALHLNQDNFFLYGQSWGGLLAMEYALKYQQHLKGLVISNMVSSVPQYNAYAKKVLMPAMNQQALAEILALEAAKSYDDPRYMALLMANFYTDHLLRLPPDQWPEPVNRSFAHLNKKVYIPMQGPSEMGASGKLAQWDRTANLGQITVPTLFLGATHDTMDPQQMKMMAGAVKHGKFVLCPNGSHLAMYDDSQAYFAALIQFIREVDAGSTQRHANTQ